MSAWGKYGDVSEIELHIGEPAFVLRAQDALAPYALQAYAALLRAAAAGAKPNMPEGATVEQMRDGYSRRDALLDQAQDVEARASLMLRWQSENHVRLPD